MDGGHESRTKSVWEIRIIKIVDLPPQWDNSLKVGRSKWAKFKQAQNEKRTPLFSIKTATTPTFCKQNVSRMHDIGDMNFFSFLTFIGNQRFGSKGYFNWNIYKDKVSIGYINDKRQLLAPNMSLDYYRFFSRKLVWFGIIWVSIPKIDL